MSEHLMPWCREGILALWELPLRVYRDGEWQEKVFWKKKMATHQTAAAVPEESHQLLCQFLILLHENPVTTRRATGLLHCHHGTQTHSSTQMSAESHTVAIVFAATPGTCSLRCDQVVFRTSLRNIPHAETKLWCAVQPSVSIMQLPSFPLQFTLPPIIYSSQDAACTSAVSLLEMPLVLKFYKPPCR